MRSPPPTQKLPGKGTYDSINRNVGIIIKSYYYYYYYCAFYTLAYLMVKYIDKYFCALVLLYKHSMMYNILY